MALQAHEIATLFPSMSTVDLDHLRESIERQGQLEDVLVYEGKILDGRHRYEACLALGIEPRLRVFEGTPHDAFVHSVALNLSRRHLTTVQRAAAGAGIKAFQARLLAATKAEADDEPIDVSIDEPEPKADAVESKADAVASKTDAAESKADAVESKADAVESKADAVESKADAVESKAYAGEATADEGKAETKAKKGARGINAKARAIASQRTGVSGRVIDAAEKIKQDAPDVFERMLAGTAGSLPDAKRVGALPLEARERVHALVDDGKDLKAALREVAPPPPPPEGALFLGKVVLEPELAVAFEQLVSRRGIKRADAVREALVEWIARQAMQVVEGAELVGAR